MKSRAERADGADLGSGELFDRRSDRHHHHADDHDGAEHHAAGYDHAERPPRPRARRRPPTTTRTTTAQSTDHAIAGDHHQHYDGAEPDDALNPPPPRAGRRWRPRRPPRAPMSSEPLDAQHIRRLADDAAQRRRSLRSGPLAAAQAVTLIRSRAPKNRTTAKCAAESDYCSQPC